MTIPDRRLSTFDALDAMIDRVERIVRENMPEVSRPYHGTVSDVAAFLTRPGTNVNDDTIITLYKFHRWLAI